MADSDNPPTDLNPAAEPQWNGTNLAGDIVEQGIKKNKQEYQDALRWYYRWSSEKGMSQTECAAELGVDAGTYSKVMRGEYKNTGGLILPPPPKMLSRMRVLHQQERENALKAGGSRIMTPTVSEIHAVCRKAWADGQLAFIFGNTHIGKSYAGVWFKDENNHGATLYVDLQGCCGEQDVWRAFARALKISADTPITKLRPRVIAAIDRTNLILADEFHFITYGYQRGGAIRMVNALKAIKDKTGCAMVIFSTNVAREEFTEGVGHEAKLMQQLWRRGVIKLQLPDALRVGDVRAFANAYSLPFPEKPAKGDFKWRELEVDHYDLPGRKLCDRIAHDLGVLHLVTVLKDGAKLAAKKGRPITWEDVERAQEAYDVWSAPKTA